MRWAVVGTVSAAVALGVAPAAVAGGACEVGIADTKVYEGTKEGAKVKMVFTVTATPGCTGAVGFRTVDAGGEGWASTPADYEAVDTVLQVVDGKAEQAQVWVVPDQATEPDEKVQVQLHDGKGLTVARPDAVGTILDDEGLVLEPHGGRIYWDVDRQYVEVPAGINAIARVPITARFRTADGTAVGGTHYVPVPDGVITFAEGADGAVVRVPLLPGAAADPGAYFVVEVFDPSAGTVGTPRVVVPVTP